MNILSPRVFNPAGRIAIVGFGSADPLGLAHTSYATRTGRFEEALPDLARIMGLVEAKEGRFYAREILQAGRRVTAPADLQARPLESAEIVQLYREYVDRHIGIRVIEPQDAVLDLDPQRFVQWILVELKEDMYIDRRILKRWRIRMAKEVKFKKGQKIRVAKEVKLGACHAGVIPSGWDLLKETGLTGPTYGKLGRAHLMMIRSAADALIRMGVPWKTVAAAIDPERRGVAAANGMAPGEYIETGMSNIVLGLPLEPHHIELYISDAMGFLLGKLLGARHASTRPAACNTGPANIEDLVTRMRLGDILFGAVATFEAVIGDPSIAGFLAKKALANDRSVAILGDHPSLISRPGLPDRSGFVMGEGGGLLLLMNMELALHLGVCIYGEILAAETAMGPQESPDPAAPTEGVRIAMEKAILKVARLDGISPEQVVAQLDFIHAHGTSTPAGDLNAIEYYARVLAKYRRDRRRPIPVIYAKGGPRLDWIPTARQAGAIGLGHLLGGAGAQASVEAMQILLHGILPPSVAGLGLVDPKIAGAEYLYFPTDPVRASVRIGKVDAQGFGDSNGEVWIRLHEDGIYLGGRETSSARAEAAAWRDEQLAAIQGGWAKPADFLPSMMGK